MKTKWTQYLRKEANPEEWDDDAELLREAESLRQARCAAVADMVYEMACSRKYKWRGTEAQCAILSAVAKIVRKTNN